MGAERALSPLVFFFFLLHHLQVLGGAWSGSGVIWLNASDVFSCHALNELSANKTREIGAVFVDESDDELAEPATGLDAHTSAAFCAETFDAHQLQCTATTTAVPAARPRTHVCTHLLHADCFDARQPLPSPPLPTTHARMQRLS
jgi:hypothetical protein